MTPLVGGRTNESIVIQGTANQIPTGLPTVWFGSIVSILRAIPTKPGSFLFLRSIWHLNGHVVNIPRWSQISVKLVGENVERRFSVGPWASQPATPLSSLR